jgi:hypothetical protein
MGLAGRWQYISSWVADKLNTRAENSEITHCEWWAPNGMSSRFLDLPPELRICVYQQIPRLHT